MWAIAILPKMKNDERPESDKSQLKITPPFGARLMNARHPKRS
jgi:hypothetical protein